MATRGIGGLCLFLYPVGEWEKVVERLERQKARVDPDQRRLYLQLMQNTVESPVDAQGRISVPQRLLDLVGIGDEVAFVGAGEVIEMWDPERYEAYVAESGQELDSWLIRYL